MKKLAYILLGLIIGVSTLSVSAQVRVFTVPQGGTGAATLTGCLEGNGTGAITGTGVDCGTGSGGTDPFTHPSAGVSATTSSMIFTNASSTFTGNLNITGNSTTTSATTTNFFSTTGRFTNMRVGAGAITFTGDVVFPSGSGTFIFKSADELENWVVLSVSRQNVFELQRGDDGVLAGLNLANLTTDRNVLFPDIDGTFLLATGTQNFILGNGTTTNATTTQFHISSILNFNGVSGNSWDDFCTTITGGAGLCDGVDNTAGSGADFAWTPGIYGSQTINATSTGLWLKGSPLGLIASTTFATNATTTNATTTNLNISGTLDVDGLTSALTLTGSTGIFAEYTGTTCTNQFVRALSVLGAATCESVVSGDITDGTITADDLGTDSVSADELNATGVEAELEAALDIGGEVTSTGMASTVIGDSIAVTSWNLTTPTLTSFFGTACTGNNFLQDISDTGAFSCAEATGGATFGKTWEVIANNFLAPTTTKSVVIGASTTPSLDLAALFQVNATGTVGDLIKASSTVSFAGNFLNFENSAGTSLFSIDSTGALTTAVDITVANGGTGASTLTDHGVLVGSGASAIDALAVGTNGQLLVGSTGADPVFATLNCADGLTCTTGAGTLEIDFDGTDSPQGELGGTWASPTLDDSVTVTGWVLGSFTGTNATTTNATSTNLFGGNFTANTLRVGGSSTTTIDSSGVSIPTGDTLTVTDLTSALTLTGAGGIFAEYTGTSCTNQFVRSLSALGVATCATVNPTDVSFLTGKWATTTADSLAIETASALRVGIGTSTPRWALQVASSTGPQLTLSDPTVATNKHWSIRNQNGIFSISTSSPTTFATSSLPAFQINDTGTGVFMPNLSQATGDNAVCIDATTDEIEDANGATCALSSRKAKENIEPIRTALEKILALNPISYTYKENGDKHYGFLAEEVSEIDPLFAENAQEDIVLKDGEVIKKGEPRSLDDRSMVANIVKAIQELWNKIVGIDERVTELEKQNAELRAEIEAIKAKI